MVYYAVLGHSLQLTMLVLSLIAAAVALGGGAIIENEIRNPHRRRWPSFLFGGLGVSLGLFWLGGFTVISVLGSEAPDTPQAVDATTLPAACTEARALWDEATRDLEPLLEDYVTVMKALEEQASRGEGLGEGADSYEIGANNARYLGMIGELDEVGDAMAPFLNRRVFLVEEEPDCFTITEREQVESVDRVILDR